jgi:hypothetical protein
MRTLPTTLALLLASGCFSSPNGDDDSGGGGGDFGFGDGGSDAGDGGDGGSNGGTPDILEPGTPSFSATFSSDSFEGEPGYWAVTDTTSLRADQEDGSIQVLITLEGDVRDGGNLVVESAQWTRSVYGDSDNDYDYDGQGDGSQTFTVEALDADSDYVWGSMDGSIELTDSMGGGAVTLTGLVVESWPKFGA